MDPLLEAFKREICDRLRSGDPNQLNQVEIWKLIWNHLPLSARETLGVFGYSFFVHFAESAYRGYPQPIMLVSQIGDATLAHAQHWSDLDALCKTTRELLGVDMVHVTGTDVAVACRFNDYNRTWIRESMPVPSDWMEAS